MIKASLRWLITIAAGLLLVAGRSTLAADNSPSDANATIRILEDESTPEQPDPEEEDKVDPDHSTTPPTGEKPTNLGTRDPQNEALPQTGAQSNLILLTAGLVVLGTLAGLTTLKRKKG